MLVIKNKLFDKITEFLKQGVSPKKLALTIVLGFTLGIIPFIGINTILLSIIAIAFRLNLAIIQLVNYSVYPIQIILYLPFMKVGQIIFKGPEFSISSNELFLLLQTEWLATVADIFHINLLGIVMWFLISLPVGIGLY